MALNVGTAKSILTVLFVMMLIAGIALLVNVLLFGIGDQAADALAVNLSSAYNDSVTTQSTAISTTSTIMGFLPWLAIGFVIIGAVGVGGLLKFSKT